jgi:hypothetical protein
MAVTLFLSAIGYNLTPQQQAILTPLASTLIESISHDTTAIKTGETIPDDPFIEPELEPPIDTIKEHVDDADSLLVKQVKGMVIEKATESIFEYLLN